MPNVQPLFVSTRPTSRALTRTRRKLGLANIGATAAAVASMYMAKKPSGNVIRPTKGSATPLPSRGIHAAAQKQRKQAKAKKLRKLKGKNLRKEVLSLKNQVKSLKHGEDASLANLTYRHLRTGRAIAVEGQQGTTAIDVTTQSAYENVLAQLKYFDSSTNTFVTASGLAGTNQKEFQFDSVSTKLIIRNNYQSDCEVSVYLCRTKGDHSSDVLSAWDAGIANDLGNIASRLELVNYPTDFDEFRDFWSAKRVVHKCLAPGESAVTYHNVKQIVYDPSFQDTRSDTYQKCIKTYSFLILIKGTLMHDTTVTTSQGLGGAGVDYQITDTYKVKYNAGMNMSYVYLVDSMDTSTGGFVQSHQPIPDNVQYSLT